MTKGRKLLEKCRKLVRKKGFLCIKLLTPLNTLEQVKAFRFEVKTFYGLTKIVQCNGNEIWDETLYY